jgi:hypothetical protein
MADNTDMDSISSLGVIPEPIIRPVMLDNDLWDIPKEKLEKVYQERLKACVDLQVQSLLVYLMSCRE